VGVAAAGVGHRGQEILVETLPEPDRRGGDTVGASRIAA